MARVLIAALTVEAAPAVAASIPFRERPLGWEVAVELTERGRSAAQRAAEVTSNEAVEALRALTSSAAKVSTFARDLATSGGGGGPRFAPSSGSYSSQPPTPPDFGARSSASGESSVAAVAEPGGGLALSAGWNLVSLPSEPGDPSPAAVFGSLGTALVQVWSFEACDAADPWKRFDPAAPGSSDLATVSVTRGYWVELRSAAVLALASGAAPLTTTIPLCPGWNQIGFPASSTRAIESALSSIAGKYLRLFSWDGALAPNQRPWSVFDPTTPAWANSVSNLSPGNGYWLLATEATELVISNVGSELVASFTSPAELAEIVGPTPIVGIASGSSLASWRLTMRALEGGEPVQIGTGTTPLSGTLGTLDPTLLLNGLHELELSVLAADGSGFSVTRMVELEGQRKIGVFTVSFVDVEFPAFGLPIQLVRTYDTRRKSISGDFGYGWTLELRAGSYRTNGPAGTSWRIAPGFLPCQTPVEGRGHRATIRLSDQEIYRFRAKLESIAPTLGGCFARFGWEQVDGPEPGAMLEVVGDRDVFWANGGRDLVLVDSQVLFDPHAARLTTRDGRKFEIDRTLGVTKLEEPNGQSLTIAPNAVTHSAGVSVQIVRDASGRIDRLIEPSGATMTYDYDAAGDLATATNAENETTTFRYLDHALYEAEDPRGEIVLRNVYSPDGRLAQTVDAFGRPILFDHRMAENIEVVTNRLGKERTYEYDARGNVIREVDELGKTTTRTFFDDGMPLSETNPLGETTRYAYDVGKNLTSVTDPLGNVSRFTYDAGGRVLTSTDPRGQVTRNVYDAKGNLTRTTGPSGEVSTYSYLGFGKLREELDALGGRTTLTYPSEPWLDRATETDAVGNVTSFGYDHAGNVYSESRSWTNEAGESETLTTGFRHDGFRRLVRTIAPDGTETRTEYHRNGQVKATIDALGRRTEMAYDAAGRPTRTTYPDGTYDESGYDAEGRRTSARDRAGRVTTFEYDDAGRMTKTIAPGGATSEQFYDDAGRVTRTIDARGKSTWFEYDAAGRRKLVRDHLGHETRFTYDAAGNQLAVTDALGRTTSFVYDASGRLVRTNFPDGTFTTTAYDALGRRTAETDQAGKTTQFGYDALGRLTSVTDALSQVTRYAYDEAGNRVAQVDANGRTTRFGYDVLGRQTSRTLPGGAIERFTYDVVGNRTSRIDFRGRTTSYGYEPETSRLLSRTYPDGSSVGFTYTVTGRRLTMTDARGTTSYGYDERDRLTSLTYPDGRQLDYGYDVLGNRTSLTAQVGGQSLATNYTYDDLNRLETVTDPAGKVYVHSYDVVGNRASLEFPNGVETTYQYDSLNRLRNLTTISTATSQTVVSFAYTLGQAGNRTRIVEHDGTTRDYTYDALYRLTDENVTLAGATRWRNAFTYDPVGNRTRQDRVETTGISRTVSYGYDERDRLLSESSTDSTAYGWDENGNQVSKSGTDGATYEWDFDNRLTRVTLANGTVVEHAYDSDGTRIRTTTTPLGGPAERVDYLVDTAGLSQVVAELNAAGAVTALHVRGGDLLATLRPSAAPSDPEIAPWVARYFHAEGIGSIRALTDASGVVANRYAFEAFGNLSSSTGEQRNSYLFAAEALDLASGLQYHRARWLQPGLGRFASVDPWPGRPTGPLSLHRYMYASVDPLSQVDPSGAFSVLALGVALAVVGIVAQIGISWLGSGVGDIPVRLRPVIVNGSRWSASEVQAQLEASRSYFARQGTGIVLSWEPVMKDDELVERYATPHFPDDLGTLVQLYNGGDAFPLVFVDRFREPNDPLGRRTGGAKWPPQPWAEVGQRCTGRRGAVITRWAGLLSPATTPHELAHVIGCIGHSEDRLNLMRGDGNPGSQLNERQVRWLRKGAKNKPW